MLVSAFQLPTYSKGESEKLHNLLLLRFHSMIAHIRFVSIRFFFAGYFFRCTFQRNVLCVLLLLFGLL